ncbi:uncharacterized protein LOC123534874 [Mercenaria mercenaria]|uniref:uncharacterized protein LOC123534874 n=1 Tax=Mercenaria mercenaria TaxID=6596 RepID=UPI00234E9DD0|nr:uncharacterized protein LOC123534874 [Mercenaria mercenaria]XP_045173267.2 uncharacterized protein LOC123534874 [Mercenaria mercenaria]
MIMQVCNISLAVSAGYYILLGLWWHVQITKKYWSSKHKKTEFTSSVTFQCCARCRSVPVEGLFKFLSSVSICVISVYQINSAQNSSEKNEAIGQLTVFSLFALSSVCDIISDCCQRIIFPGLDYLVLVICFNVQSVVLSYHSVASYSWMSVADTCAMYAATFAAVALLLEFKYSHYIWFPLIRSFCTVVLGTWFAHMCVVLLKQSVQSEDSIPTSTENSTITIAQGVHSSNFTFDGQKVENLSLVPMYFSWHCLFNMNLLTILWVVVYKLASKNCCVCMPDEERINHFENRVHFDYHMITRMTDSDYEE